ncbi:alkaline phosphatase family protein [Marmoricola sp. URHB0036]|uniref:alkaline phosphatase family protein n=1 Tax=Marmoricola sp. URHB0036 TaxID=1298863 RepID=UPI000409AFBA|nr:alkaline phosphatase family protein [Marmoricola sp. URHB0036]
MTNARSFTAAVLSAAALLTGLAGCGSSQHPNSSPATTSDASDTSSPTSTAAKPTKVLVVIEENHSYTQMKAGMPFLAGLAAKYGYASHWTALAHPSLPNYLGIAGGTTFGILDDKAPAAHTADIGSATSVFDQAIAAGKTAGTYAETMPENCHVYDFPDRSVGTPKYAVRHNPWVYFSKGRTSCLAHDRDLAPFAGDAARNALPNVGFLIPNLDHDAHDGSLATADSWLKQQLSPVVKSTDFTSGKLVVVVTADEDDKKSGNVVLTSVLTPRISHKVVTTPLTHYSLTRFIAQLLGVKPLKNGATAPDMAAAFGL